MSRLYYLLSKTLVIYNHSRLNLKLIAKQIMSVNKSVKRTLLDNTLGVLSQRLERPLIKAKIWNISINKSTDIEYIILKTSRQKDNLLVMSNFSFCINVFKSQKDMQSWNNYWSLPTNHACLSQYWLPKCFVFQHADAFEKFTSYKMWKPSGKRRNCT